MKNYENLTINEKYQNNHFEIKKNIVLKNESKIFKNWQENINANINKNDFIDNLKWLCEDARDEQGRYTRFLFNHVKKGLMKCYYNYTKNSTQIFPIEKDKHDEKKLGYTPAISFQFGAGINCTDNI